MVSLTTQEEAVDVPRAVLSELAYHPTYQKHRTYVLSFIHFITGFGDCMDPEGYPDSQSVQRMKMQAFCHETNILICTTTKLVSVGVSQTL